jgi:hypothetical protein
MRDLFPTELVTKVKPNINSVKVHPQLSNNGHPVDGVLGGAGLLWPKTGVVHSLVGLRELVENHGKASTQYSGPLPKP